MHRQYHYGLTLVELLVSLVISSVLFLAATLALQHSLQAKHKLEQQMDRQKTVRYAQHIITRAIRMAGYFGCHSLSQSHLHSSLHSVVDLHPIGTHFPIAIFATSKKESETLYVYHLAANAIQLTHGLTDAQAPITIEHKLVKRHSIAVLGDCQQSDIFAVSQISGRHIWQVKHAVSRDNKLDTFSKVYSTGAFFGPLVADQFFVRDQGLYETQINHRSEELLSGINAIHFSFSRRQHSHHFIASKFFTDWQQVALVKVKLTLTDNTAIDFIVRARN